MSWTPSDTHSVFSQLWLPPCCLLGVLCAPPPRHSARPILPFLQAQLGPTSSLKLELTLLDSPSPVLISTQLS